MGLIFNPFTGNFDFTGTDGGGGGDVTSVNGQTGDVQLDAADIPYDNTDSGLTADDVQAAIDELATADSGFANKTLSNLESPTAINETLYPSETELHDIGSSGQRWANVYAQNINATSEVSGAVVVSPFHGAFAGETGLYTQENIGESNITVETNYIDLNTDANSGGLYLRTGAATGTGNSGDILIANGTVESGSRGRIHLNTNVVQVGDGPFTIDPASNNAIVGGINTTGIVDRGILIGHDQTVDRTELSVVLGGGAELGEVRHSFVININSGADSHADINQSVIASSGFSTTGTFYNSVLTGTLAVSNNESLSGAIVAGSATLDGGSDHSVIVGENVIENGGVGNSVIVGNITSSQPYVHSVVVGSVTGTGNGGGSALVSVGLDQEVAGEHFISVGNTHTHSAVNKALTVGHTMTIPTVDSSLIAGSSLDINSATNSVVVGNGETLNDITQSLVIRGYEDMGDVDIYDAIVINSATSGNVDTSILIETQTDDTVSRSIITANPVDSDTFSGAGNLIIGHDHKSDGNYNKLIGTTLVADGINHASLFGASLTATEDHQMLVGSSLTGQSDSILEVGTSTPALAVFKTGRTEFNQQIILGPGPLSTQVLNTFDQTDTTVSNQLTVRTGHTESADTGALLVTTGESFVSGNSGPLTLRTGNTESGDTGSVAIGPGFLNNTGTRGDLSLDGNGIYVTSDDLVEISATPEVIIKTDVVKYGQGASATDFLEELYIDSITLAANTSAPADITELTVDATVYSSLIIDYQIREQTSFKSRVGRLFVTSNETDAAFNDQIVETDTIGIGLVLDVVMDGSDIVVRYNNTDTTNACIMRCKVTRFRA